MPVRFPQQVSIDDVLSPTIPNGSSTPAGEPSDDFFSSWDKPVIKRPSNPPSRTQTPPVASRTASPFLNATASSTTRPKSSLGAAEAEAVKPAASRTTSSSALRKTVTAGGPRKANILGAKKTTKLGAKKIGTDALDFEAAERKANEEAERREKLGYDPEAEEAVGDALKSPLNKPDILSPTPISPPRAGFGAQSHKRRPSELERLGLGMGRLGFGQVGGAAKSSSATMPTSTKLGFGSIGTPKKADDGMALNSRSPVANFERR